MQGAGHQVQQGRVSVGGFGPRHRQRPRRGLHQADLRRGNASRDRRRHRRHACRRPDQRSVPGDRDGRRRGGYRQDHPSAPDAGRVDRHGGGDLRRDLHRRAAPAQALRLPLAVTKPALMAGFVLTSFAINRHEFATPVSGGCQQKGESGAERPAGRTKKNPTCGGRV
ncbi:hypothetical protein CBM2589_B120199 [Cupriavidus taiwanensis]|uniref:Uncharacterized protein n=1 Tax=Cupriavidus taiwanensis TaxID=164546 RepID=A0A975WU38_9BURK|nr:hypothetical protein CBM2589_B120199 [Cupriavidus taiwanensis]